MDEISIKLGLGMTMGRVRDGFLYAWTCPVGLPPLPEPDPFNKRIFFNPQTRPVKPLWASSSHVKFGPNPQPKSWPNKKKLGLNWSLFRGPNKKKKLYLPKFKPYTVAQMLN